MSEDFINLRYVGGLFDGEGYCGFKISKKQRQKYIYDIEPNISIHLGKDYEIDSDWLAGFFDAEGSAVLAIEKIKGSKFNHSVRPIICIVQKNRRLIEKLRSFLGFGSIYETKVGTFVWTTTSLDHCRKFVDLLIDKVELKRLQLALMRKALDIMAEPREKTSGRPIKKENVLRLIHLAEAIRYFNSHRKPSKNLANLKKVVLSYE